MASLFLKSRVIPDFLVLFPPPTRDLFSFVYRVRGIVRILFVVVRNVFLSSDQFRSMVAEERTQRRFVVVMREDDMICVRKSSGFTGWFLRGFHVFCLSFLKQKERGRDGFRAGSFGGEFVSVSACRKRSSSQERHMGRQNRDAEGGRGGDV
jgi:hypothetical protein